MSYDTLPEIPWQGQSEGQTSHPAFGSGTSGTEVAQAFAERIRGRTIIITGVSPKSLGEALAEAIATHCPAKLMLASRTRSKLEAVRDNLRRRFPHVQVHLVELDLASQKSIFEAAETIKQLAKHVDVLINNAAVVSSERRETKELLEQTFGTNHIGHFLLTYLLTPLLLAGARTSDQPGRIRVVNVTSLGYRLSAIRFHDPNFQGLDLPPEHVLPPYSAFRAYGQSKTANILHCVSLNEKYAEAGIRAFAVHPGSIWTTDLSRNLTPEDLKIIEGTSTEWISHDQGIATILVAAFDPKLAEANDRVFMSDCQFQDVDAHAKDSIVAQRLWRLSMKLIAVDPRADLRCGHA